jgi:acyl-[acyl-carrier-protein] desaturase
MPSDQYQEKLWKLFRTFFDDAEEKRRWNPYRDVPWDKVNKDVPEELALCAETFLGVESYLPDYIRGALSTVRVSSIGQRWFSANWGYEELKHSIVLCEYLIRSGKRTQEQVFDYQAQLMQEEWKPPFPTARQMTIYAVFQEKATFVIYLRHEALAKKYNCEALAACYRFNARDEIAHAKFYEDTTRCYLEEDRIGTICDLAHVSKNFQMPGVGIVPNYDSRIEVMREYGEVDRDIFLQKVYFPTLKSLGVTRQDLVEAGKIMREQQKSAAIAAAE